MKKQKNTKNKSLNAIILKSKKFRITYFVLAGILLMSTAAYAGFVYWRAHNLKAQAKGYTRVVNNTNFEIKACKQAVTIKPYGAFYKIKAVYFNKSPFNKTPGAELIIYDGRDASKTVTNKRTWSFYLGAVATLEGNASRIRGDNVVAMAGLTKAKNGQVTYYTGGEGLKYISALTDC